MGLRRSLTPEDDQLEILGEELLLWCEEDVPKKERQHLFFSQWYSGKKNILRAQWKAMIQHPNFRPYYEQAASILGYKLVTGSIKEGLAHRFIRIYHADVREDDDEIAAAKNKSNNQAITGDEIIKAIREDMNARTKSQSLRGVPPVIESDLADK